MTPGVGLVERMTRLWRRRRAAQRLGIRFHRAALFALPGTIRLNGRVVTIDVPNKQHQRVAFVELLLDDCYHLKSLARYAKIRTVIDVGANIGLFGLAARDAFPDAIIHAYEPNATLRPVLAHQAKLADVEVFFEAVGRDAGMVSLDVDPAESVLGRTRPDPSGSIQQIAFREALDRIGGHADLVKLDCEGAEWKILEDRESWRKVAHITMEYHLAEDQGHAAIVAALGDFAVRSQTPSTNFGMLLADRIVR